MFTRIRNAITRLSLGYHNLQIKHKLFLVHFLIVGVVCGVTLGVLQFTLTVYDGLIYQESAKVLNLSTISIESELKRIEKLSYYILSNLEIQQSLERLKTELTLAPALRLESGLRENLWVYACEQNIRSVNLVDLHGRQFSGGPSLVEPLVNQVIREGATGAGQLVFSEPYPGEQDLICIRQIRQIRGLSLEPLGTLALRVDIGEIVRQCTQGEWNAAVDLLIFSGQKTIYASEEELGSFGKRLDFSGDSGHYVQKINGINYFFTYTRSKLTGWTIVNILPYQTVFKQILWIRNALLLVFLVIFLFAIYISMQLARTITRPIEHLTETMKRAEQGDFESPLDSEEQGGRRDEIGVLQSDFRKMLQKINILITENYTKQLAVKDAQFKALQAQINPHFLYNTLESVNWLAKVNHAHQIARMVQCLGNLLRSALSNNEAIIALGDEITLLNDYITIQKIRFGERLDFRLDLDSQWLNLCIPKLSLQPIIENAIHHGLEQTLNVCEIRVSAVSEPDALRIIVEDNGPGFPPDFLHKLERGEITPKGYGIGLKNIAERMRLIFGNAYGLSIDDSQHRGGRIMLRIPKSGGEYVSCPAG